MSARHQKRRRRSGPPPPDNDAIETYGRFVRAYFLLVILVTVPKYLDVAWNKAPIWFLLDEMQHYDVIDRLSTGHMPNQRDVITDYTERITAGYFGFAVDTYDGTKESLGALRFSYEGQQPPVYYMLLAPLNLVLKRAGVLPPTLIRTLRSFNVLFYAGTTLLIMFIFDDLASMVGYPRLFGYFMSCFYFVTRFRFRGHISNDHFSPLICALGLWAMVRLWRTGRSAYVGWSALAVALAILTKYTNGYLLLLWLANSVCFYRRRGWPAPRDMVRHLAPMLLPVGYLGGKLLIGGLESLSQAPAMQALLQSLTEPPDSSFALRGLMDMSLPTVAQPYQAWLTPLCYAAMAVNLIWSGRRVFVARDHRAVPLFVACVTSLLIALGALVLNATVYGVLWYYFRYYEGFAVVWYTAVTGAPLLFRSRRFGVAAACLGVLLVTFGNDFWAG